MLGQLIISQLVFFLFALHVFLTLFDIERFVLVNYGSQSKAVNAQRSCHVEIKIGLVVFQNQT